jgi:uncharacterized protein YggU (UPF0235/DUF167 family)
MSKKPYLTIEVKVKLRAKQSLLEQVTQTQYQACLHSIAEKNKANLELLQLIASYFKVNQASVRIIKGLNSKNKIIAIYE